MAAWRIVIRNLYLAGGQGTCEVAGGDFYTPYQAGNALVCAVRHGLVRGPGRGQVVWTLTQRGIDWCENRVTQVEQRPGGRRWISTWLSSLPRDITLQRSQA